jgi:hypothetical protein
MGYDWRDGIVIETALPSDRTFEKDLPTYYAERVFDQYTHDEQEKRWIDDMALHAIAPGGCNICG